MSRASGGTYTLPAGNPVVTGAVISSTWANTTLSDIATALTDSLSRTGLGGMSAPLSLTDGAIGTPGLTFGSETTMGLYRAAAGDMRFAIGGADSLRLSTNTITLSTAAAQRATVNSTGNWTFSAPSAGVALTVNLLTGSAGLTVTGDGSGATMMQLTSSGGTTGRNVITLATTGAVTQTWIFGNDVTGGSTGSFGLRNLTGATVPLLVSTAGAFTIAAPSAGVAFTINAIAGSAALVLNPANSASVGIQLVDPGANNTNLRLNTVNASANVQATGTVPVLTLLAGATTVATIKNAGVAFTINGIAGTHSTKIDDSAGTSFNAGFLESPLNTKNVAYTTVLEDSGKTIYHSDGTARTYTIDSNANVAYPIGTVITFINDASAGVNVTISITTDVLAFANDGSTGSRTLARFGRATAQKVTATRWIIGGIGLT